MKDFYQIHYNDLTVYQTPNLWSTYQNYNYILARKDRAIIIDPGEFEPIDNTITKNNLTIEGIYLTHHHGDHVGATKDFINKYQCEVFGFLKDKTRLPCLTQTFDENETLDILETQAQVLFLPGHTHGLCAFYFKKEELLFSNDHLFSLGCGRVFEGTHEQMFNSLNAISRLPDSTILFPSHEYTESNLNFSLHQFPSDKKLAKIKESIYQKRRNGEPTLPTTLGFEKTYNLFLRTAEPDLAKALNLSNATPLEVFTELRSRKDRF